MFSFNKNSISFKRHMLPSWEQEAGPRIEIEAFDKQRGKALVGGGGVLEKARS